MSRIENGHLTPSLDVLRKLTDIFDVSYDYLLNEETDNYDVRIKDKSLANIISMIDTLCDMDKKALSHIIDTMLTKQKMRTLLLQETANS